MEEEGRRKLSAALTISHAAADGYHASMFFERLQEVLDEFVINGVEGCGYKTTSLAKIQPK